MKKLLCLLIFATHVVFAAITIGVKPSKVRANDDFQLLFTYKGNKSHIVPDFTPLENNFEILATSKSTRLSVINGKVSSETQWQVTLNAKRPGKFTIPRLAFGNEFSEEVTLTVFKATAVPTEKGKAADIFMTTELNKDKAYVQSQLIYRVKLFYTKPISSGNFSEPEVPGSMITRINGDRSYQTKVNGKRYMVHERDYAIFPQKSGELKISAPLFQGIMRRDNFTNINQILMDVHKPVKIQANPRTIDILPIPANYKSPIWLPASKLELKESWQGLHNNIDVGQPITREITLSATGLAAEQLPNLDFNKIKGANVYPQKSTSKNLVKDENIIGQKTFKIVYIPTQGGKLKIPEEKVYWWNTDKEKQQIATLKGNQLKITAVANQAQVQTPMPPKAQPSQSNIAPMPIKQVPETLNKPSLSGNILLPWALTTVLALSWLVFFALRLFRKKTSSQDKTPSQQEQLALKHFKSQFKKACVESNKRKASELLLLWAKARWPNHHVHSLSDAKRLAYNKAFTEAIDDLCKSLYSRNKVWQGQPLWVAWLVVEDKAKSQQSAEFKLPSLNPTRA